MEPIPPTRDAIEKLERLGDADVASAAHGVQSSLSMPIVDQGRVGGGVNLYASTRDAFRGHHDELARIVGAHAPDAVQDADLSFSTRERAAAAPAVLAAQTDIDMAVGVIAVSQGVDIETALSRLREAANRSGSTDLEVARTVIRLRLQ